MKKILSLSALSLSASLVCAAPIELNGSTNVSIPVSDQSGVQKTLEFTLPKYKLSTDVLNQIKEKLRRYPANSYQNKPRMFAMDLPPKVQLGMEGTPVLDQGRHGSCVTFATTAAINAAMGAGDYVSQLCSLELGASLAINDELPISGWNGSFGEIVLYELFQFGVVSQNHQKMHGCAGVQQYPLDDKNNEGHPMTKEDYLKVSVPIHNVIQWDVLMSPMDMKLKTDMPGADAVWVAKEALAKGHRVSIGMLLDVKQGHVGAVGMNKVLNDTWMVNPEIIMDAVSGVIEAGHELVVTGYDDNAEVIDEKGYTNKGVFKVRNSWSRLAGDQGEYYISYDHFNIFVDEMHAIYVKK